jgi:hypothetical protein
VNIVRPQPVRTIYVSSKRLGRGSLPAAHCFCYCSAHCPDSRVNRLWSQGQSRCASGS